MDTIIVGIQDVCESGAALGFAIKEAAFRGASLRIVHTWGIAPRPGAIHPEAMTDLDLEGLEQDAKRVVALALECARRIEPSVAAEGKAVFGETGETLLDEAKAALAQSSSVLLVIDDSRPADIRGRSTIRQLLRHSPCPLTIVPGRRPKGRRRQERAARTRAEGPEPSRDRMDVDYRDEEKDYALLSLADVAVLGRVDWAPVERQVRADPNFPKPLEYHPASDLYDRRAVYKWAIEAGLKGLDLAP